MYPDYPDMGGTVHQRSVVRVGATLIVASLALTACGSRNSGDNGGGSGGSTKTAKIGVIAPLSGDLSALGLGIQHSVELAVKQANDNNTIPGWKLEVVPKDDEAKTEPGKNAATSICPGGNGCIAIFMSANDDPGICGGKEETAFKNQVCPGKPGTN